MDGLVKVLRELKLSARLRAEVWSIPSIRPWLVSVSPRRRGRAIRPSKYANCPPELSRLGSRCVVQFVLPPNRSDSEV